MTDQRCIRLPHKRPGNLLMILALCIPLLCAGQSVLGNNDAGTAEGKIAALEKNVAYLKSRSIDVKSLQDKINVIKKDLTDYKNTLSRKGELKNASEKDQLDIEAGLRKRILDSDISVMEDSISLKIASIGRLDFFYFLTAIFGVGFVIMITTYTIWMYMKRR